MAARGGKEGMEMREGRRGDGCRGGGPLRGARTAPRPWDPMRAAGGAGAPGGGSARPGLRAQLPGARRSGGGRSGETEDGSRAGGLGGFGRIRSNPWRNYFLISMFFSWPSQFFPDSPFCT